ncbi:Serine/threonine-protein kinase PknB [Roseovarius albus]|uniref:Serine/threonine-protein kinase PknB n=1 Tax=Roseovarius albus TaxID=1247867 RepID=A0A1X6YM46_9RHOB|nr:serine/threonine-protein kinase [Roseovarius albus]SLN25452.1 Serine/threonine-protein kinase PknB [Roseovarius albus]
MSQNRAVEDTQDENQIVGLKPGAKLLRGQYEIISFLSNGGFGITYLARDSLERDVVIKECFPGALCRRNGDLVEAVDPAYNKDLRSIIELFILEARNHARLVHPNIVDVHQVFEDNDTAYIAMDLIKGCDLLDYVQDSKNDSSPDFIVQVTEKMLSAVSFIHDSGMLHRDISPDNILIDENKQPVLIDFGAAREQAANKSAALLTLRVIKDGYSPHEFYVRGAEQGPSSDLYVLAATLYHTISGERPIDGQTRLDAFNNSQPDPYEPLSGRFEGYPKGFLEAIDKAMEIHVPDRLQSALEWLRMFRGKKVEFDNFSYRPVSVIVAVDREDEEELSEAEQERIRAETENAEAVVNALLTGDIDAGPDVNQPAATSKAKPAQAMDTVVRNDSGGNGKLMAGAMLVVIALAAGGYFAMSGGEDEVAVTTDVTVATTVVEPTAEEPVVEEAGVEEVPAAITEAVNAEETVEPAAAPEEAAAVAEIETPTTTEPEVAGERVSVEEIPAVEPKEVEVAVASEPAETSVVEATVEDVSEAAVAEPVNLRDEQIAFSHWDVDIPFRTSVRKISTASAIAINNVDRDADMSVIGDWVERGAVIFTLNGEPIRKNVPLATQIMNGTTADEDGYFRIVARYRAKGQTRVSNGLLALPAVHVIGLGNGVTFAVSSDAKGGWNTRVSELSAGHGTTLRVDDIIVQEQTTGVKFDGQDSLKSTLEKLVELGNPKAEFTIMRLSGIQKAHMELVAK